MTAQIEVFSKDEAIALGKWFDENGYTWNDDGNIKRFFEFDGWEEWLPHKFFFIGLFELWGTILHSNDEYSVPDYDYEGGLAGFLDYVAALDRNGDFETATDDELFALLQ